MVTMEYKMGKLLMEWQRSNAKLKTMGEKTEKLAEGDYRIAFCCWLG